MMRTEVLKLNDPISDLRIGSKNSHGKPFFKPGRGYFPGLYWVMDQIGPTAAPSCRFSSPGGRVLFSRTQPGYETYLCFSPDRRVDGKQAELKTGSLIINPARPTRSPSVHERERLHCSGDLRKASQVFSKKARQETMTLLRKLPCFLP